MLHGALLSRFRRRCNEPVLTCEAIVVRVIMVCLMLVAAPCMAHAANGDRWDGATIALQSGGGLGGLAVGTGLGVGIGYALGDASSRPGDWGAPLAGGLIGGVLGGTLGLVLGVQLVGDAEDGTGRWYGTTLGAVGGVALFGTYLYAFADSRPPKVATAFLGTVLLLGGPIVGYHLSGDPHRAQPAPRLVVPLFVATF